MQRVGIDLLNALQRRGDIQVESLILRAAGLGMVAKAVPFYSYALMKIWRLCQDGQVDAVLFSGMPSAWMAVFIKPALARPVPMATICHGHDVIMDVAPYQWLVRNMFKTLDAVFPVSQATGDAVLQRGLDPSRLHVINNGIDITRYGEAPDPGSRRAILAATFPLLAAELPANALLLCTTGRQIRRKGHEWFVDKVMPRLPPHIHFWLAGDGPEGSAIDDAIQRHKLETRVRRLGLLSEDKIAGLYRGGDLFIMPNIAVKGDIEGFGVVLLEAGLNGMPAVAVRLEGIADAVTDGRNGVLVQSGNPDSFINAIKELDEDRERLTRLGLSAADFTRERFSWDGIAGRYVAVLEELASTSR